MCLSHWKLVPQDHQRAVTRTWGLFSRAKSAVRALERRKDYLAARDAAVISAQLALAATPQNGPDLLGAEATLSTRKHP